MNIENEDGRINEITVWDIPDESYEPDGYHMKIVPACTHNNMLKLMDKINELVNEINKLKGVK